MFELSQISSDAPLAFIALAVLYNLLRHALNLYDARKREADEEATHERIVTISAQLARAEEELKHLRQEIAELKKKGA